MTKASQKHSPRLGKAFRRYETNEMISLAVPVATVASHLASLELAAGPLRVGRGGPHRLRQQQLQGAAGMRVRNGGRIRERARATALRSEWRVKVP